MKQLIRRHLAGAWYVSMTCLFCLSSWAAWFFFHVHPLVIVALAALFMTLLYICFRTILVTPLKQLTTRLDAFAEGKSQGGEVEIDAFHYDIEKILAFFNSSVRALRSIKKDFIT